jgi:phosphoglycerate dehydrogenase-like enzyme
MIRILVATSLSPKAIDQLNEIPEFEISERAGLTSERLRDEIRSADALVIGDSPVVTAEVLEAGADLKLIVSSGPSGSVDEAAARRQRVEVRRIPGAREADAGAIAVLKDFFNV